MPTINEQFTHQTLLPRRKVNFLVWFLALFAGTILIQNMISSAIVFLLGGVISAYIWKKIGWKMTYRTYIEPLRKIKENPTDNSLSSRIMRYVYATDINKVFLQFETSDTDISTLKKLLKESTRIFISFFAIAISITRILYSLFKITGDTSGPVLSGILAISFLIAFPALSFYVPQSLITRDAKVMFVHKDGSIKYAGGRIRDTLDGFFGLTGILSGFDLLRDRGLGLIESLFIFLFFILFGTIIASPALFPAVLFYFRTHSDLVNQFRDEIVKLKIYPARTTALPITSQEMDELGIGEIRKPIEEKPKNIFDKIGNIILGPKLTDTGIPKPVINKQQTSKPEMSIPETQESIDKNERNCSNCNTPVPENTASLFCQKCGNKIN